MAEAKKPANRRNAKPKKPAAGLARATKAAKAGAANSAKKPATPKPSAAAKPSTQTKPAAKVTDAEQEVSAQKPVELAPDSPPPTAQKPTERRSTMIPLIAGGALAAAIGFGVERYLVPDNTSAPPPDEIRAVVQAALDRQSAATASVEGLVAELRSDLDAASAAAASQESVAAVQATLGAYREETSSKLESLSDSLAALDARLTEVEKRPVAEAGGATGAAVAAYERELNTMRELLETQRAQIEQLAAAATSKISDAEERARVLDEQTAAATAAATSRAALSRILAALEAGGGYKSALDELSATRGVAAPAALASVAETGVPTLAQLQSSYPDAARRALEASIAAVTGDGAMDRLGAFLRTQTGARSLEPREGNDPDAILSRAEAALRQGQLDVTLALIAALPDEGEAAMADWVESARTRLNALAAARKLANSLNDN